MPYLLFQGTKGFHAIFHFLFRLVMQNLWAPIISSLELEWLARQFDVLRIRRAVLLATITDVEPHPGPLAKFRLGVYFI